MANDSSAATASASTQRKLVVLDHDGGHDDLVALALLLARPSDVEVLGCVVTDADCFVQEAFSVTGKLMALMHVCEGTALFPVACSSFHGVNPFPRDWRWHAKNMDDLPCLNIPAHVRVWERVKEDNAKLVGEQLLADLVMNAPSKVTICVTGPLSNVAWCIATYGEAFCRNVAECVIMGGAVDVAGNVFLPERGVAGAAEWNVYWDPTAAQTVLTCPHMRNVLFALDATNDVPITSELVHRFGAQNEYLLSQFIGSAWASCTHYALMRPNDGYYAWDVLTAAYAIDSSMAQLEECALDVETAAGASEGATRRVQRETAKTLVARKAQASRFYDLVVTSARRARVHNA